LALADWAIVQRSLGGCAARARRRGHAAPENTLLAPGVDFDDINPFVALLTGV
jgi:hypothetical protein